MCILFLSMEAEGRGSRRNNPVVLISIRWKLCTHGFHFLTFIFLLKKNTTVDSEIHYEDNNLKFCAGEHMFLLILGDI